MKPALLRVLPAAALSVPLLVAGVATATAATASPAQAPVGTVSADEEMEGHDGDEMAGHDDEEMSGHDEEEMSGHEEDDTAGHEEEEPSGHDEDSDDEHGSTPPGGDRPRVAVLSSFAGVNAAVLGGAAFLRRRDRRAVRHRPRSVAEAKATQSGPGVGNPAPTAPASDS